MAEGTYSNLLKEPTAMIYTVGNSTSSNYSDVSSKSFDHNQQTRIIALWILFVVGVFGNILAFYWLWLNRRRKSRVNKIILGLVSADVMVCIFVMLLSVIFVMNGYRWTVGNWLCKIVMHLQSTSLMGSSNMLVMLAIDRHQAVRSPLREAFSVKKMMTIAWTCAILLSLPQLIVWRVKLGAPDFPTCGTNLLKTPQLRLAYIIYAAVVMFLIPLVMISIAYMRITKKIWNKARESIGKRQSRKGKLRITSTGTSLHRAKHKTFKMASAIIALFGICSLPYFLIEILVTTKLFSINVDVYAIFGIFSASNSAINPYIFLWFNSGGKFCSALLDFTRVCCNYYKSTRRKDVRASICTSSTSHDNTLRSELEWKSAVRTDYRTDDDKECSIPLHAIKEEAKTVVKYKPKKYDYPKCSIFSFKRIEPVVGVCN